LVFPLQLVPETLFLTTNVIDRFLEAKEVSRKNLQLVRGSWVCSATVFVLTQTARRWG
jgi:hypothetical protein